MQLAFHQLTLCLDKLRAIEAQAALFLNFKLTLFDLAVITMVHQHIENPITTDGPRPPFEVLS